MFKTLFFISLCCLSLSSTYAQNGIWTWMKGNQTPNSAGSYGFKGVSAPGNTPPNRYQAAYWRDLEGNFWLFGGSSKSGLNIVLYNDLWKYTVSNNEWTWMGGPQYLSDQNGNFGTQGIPSINNYPSARGNGSICWVDLSGDFWLYGGEGIDALNGIGLLSDLWHYKVNTGEWTWVKGSNQINQPAIYGIQGAANNSNTPGARSETQSGWVDIANHLWMSGGNSSSSSSLFLGDLWMYNISTNEWTWMKGPNIPNSPGNYGSLGIEDPNNQPPPRWSYTKWKSNDGNFYTFAGQTQTGSSNDVWQYKPASNNWTWISGNSTANQNGTYVSCNPNINNFPSARYENQTAQTVGCSDVFWTFGGRSFSLSNYNDLWIFNTANLQWTFVSGNSTLNNPGNFGTQGVPASSNMISARFGVCMWTDTANNVWIFGGQDGSNLFNDLWRFKPDTSCFSAPLVASFELIPPFDTVLCYGDTASMIIPNTANVSWSPSGAVFPNIDTSMLYFAPISNTTFTVTGIDTGTCPGADTLVFSLLINANNTPNLIKPIDTLICPGEFTTMNLDPALNIQYFPSNGVVPNVDTSVLSFSPNSTTSYTVIGRYGVCSQPDTVVFTIVVQNQGQVILNNPTPLSICEGDTTFMNLDPNYTVSWSPPTNVFPNADTSLLGFNPTTYTTYTIQASIGGICPATTSISFGINVLSSNQVQIPFITDTTICEGTSLNIALKNAQEKFVSVTPNQFVVYLNDSNKISLSPTTTTTYTLIARGGLCSLADTLSFTITVKPSPIADFTLSPQNATLKNAYFEMNNQSQNANKYLWFLNYIPFSTSFNAQKQITKTGNFCFQLAATGSSGCIDTAEVCGTVSEDPSYLQFPNAFTPNGDGINDEFRPIADNVKFLRFQIFDRWGTEMFSDKTGLWGWDGKYKSSPMPNGVYFYYFKYSIQGVEQVRQGDLTLIR